MPSSRLLPGFALDLTCIDVDDGLPWDFDDKEKRDNARRLYREQKPLFLIGSPVCTAWCTWQRINNLRRDPETVAKELAKARVHLGFVLELYMEQIKEGRFFLHEHPQSATSWYEDDVKEILAVPSVGRVDGDQCQYGAQVVSGSKIGSPIRKCTGFMSNGEHILNALSKRCRGSNGRCSRTKGGIHAH